MNKQELANEYVSELRKYFSLTGISIHSVGHLATKLEELGVSDNKTSLILELVSSAYFHNKSDEQIKQAYKVMFPDDDLLDEL